MTTFLLRRPLPSVLLIVAGLVAAVAIACGGGDESPEETATSAPAEATEAPTEAATEAATEAPATEPPATEAPAAAEDSVDVRYLRAICIAGNDLQTAMFTAAIRLETQGGDPEDPEAFQELFVEPLAGFLEAIRDVEAPNDLADYHTAALAQYEALVTLFATIAEGGEELGDEDPFALLLGGMMEGVEEMPEIPQEALDRLAVVAEDVPECEGSIILPEFLGQGSQSDSGVSMEDEPGGEPDPEAEAYVRELCLAGDTYEATFQQALADLGADADFDESDPEVFATVFGEAIAGLAADMAVMTPPDEIAQYHAGAVARFGEMAALLQSIMGALDAGQEPAAGDLDAFQQILQGGLGMPDLPFDEANRLGLAANNVIECYQSGFLYGLLSGAQ